MRSPMAKRRALALALAVGAAACASILGIRPREREPFEHRQHVLAGIHCSRCHGGIVGAGDTGPLHIPGKAECLTCHERPHDTRTCSMCHGLPETREGVTLARENLRFQHKTHVPRVRGDCVRCHVDIHRNVEHIRPGMGTCLACHEHEDDFQIRNCDRCHANLHTEETPPESHLVHDGDWRREHGSRAPGAREMCETCHSESFCASCHGVTTATTPERLRVDEPFSPGIHRGSFRARHGDEARGNPGLCTTCHAPEVCVDCHREEGRSARGDAPGTPHPQGWLGLRGESPNDHGPAARRDPAACAACHSGAGEALCVGCHRVGGIGGNPHPRGWSSSVRSSAERERFDPACRPCHEAAR